jgi:hypothetical protein
MPTKPAGPRAYALFGTPDEINNMLDAVRNAGAEYVLLTVSGGIDQLRRFKRDIMPNFSRPPKAEPVTRAAE